MGTRVWVSQLVRRWVPALAVAATMALTACGGDDSSSSSGGGGDGGGGGGGEPYTIGATSDISGPIAATYAPILEGFRVYTDWLNDKGGVDGHPIEVLVRDHKSDPSLVASDARFFNQRSANAIMFAGPSSTLASYLQAMGDAPTVYGNSCYPPAPPPKVAPNFFCVGVSPATDAKALVDLLIARIESEGGKTEDTKLALVAEDIPGCRVVAKDAIAPDAESRGMKVVAQEVVPVNVTNLRPTAEKIRKSGANAVIHYCLSAQMVALGDALGQIEWDGTYLAAANIPGMIKGIAKAKNPNFFGFDWFALPSDDVQVIKDIDGAAKKYKAKYPVEDLRWGWAIGMTFAESLRQCGFPCDRKKLTDVMNALKMDSDEFVDLFGSPLEWSKDNHTSPSKAYRLIAWDEERQDVVGTTDWIKVDEVGMGGE